MTFPVIEVSCAFFGYPGDPAPAFVDITDYCEETLSIKRGRSMELDQFAAGTCKLSLDNKDRRFDPENASGAYNPFVKPMVRIDIAALHNAVSYSLFHGHVDGWPQEWQSPASAVIEISATDSFKVLAALRPPTPWPAEVTTDAPVHWWKLNDPVGSTTVADVGSSPTHALVTAAVELGQTAIVPYGGDQCVEFGPVFQGDDQIKLPDGVSGITAAAFSFECWFKFTGTVASINSTAMLYQQVNPSTGYSVFYLLGDDYGADAGKLVFAISDGVDSNVTYSSTTVDDGEVHHLVYTSTGTTHKVYIDGVDSTGTDDAVNVGAIAAGHTYIGWNEPTIYTSDGWIGFLSDVLIYSSALSAVRVAAHYNAGGTGWAGDTSGTRIGRILDAIAWPAAYRDLDTGASTMDATPTGSVIALNELQVIEQTEEGLLYIGPEGYVTFVGRNNRLTESRFSTSQNTFGDSGSELQYEDLVLEYNDQTIFNDARVASDGGTEQVAEDATSITNYLRRTRSLTGLRNLTDIESKSHAEWIVGHYKDPLTRVRQVVLRPSAHDTTTMWAACLGRKIGDRVTIKKTTPAGAVLTEIVLIEGISHEVNGVDWVTTFTLSPADTQEYWVLGTSALDTGTRLAF